MCLKDKSLMVAACALGTVLSLHVEVFAHGSDVGLIARNGRLVTVEAEGEPPTQVFGSDPMRVFGVDLEFIAADNLVGVEEPGFATSDAAVLGQTIGFTHLRALRRWNAVAGAFESTSFTMTAGRTDLGLANVTTPTTDTPTPITPIPNFPDDMHYLWTLDQATSASGEGIYLVEGIFTNPVVGGNGLASSEPVWFVFNYGLDEEEHDAAIEYVESTLVPTPGAAIIGAMGLAAAARRRRR